MKARKSTGSDEDTNAPLLRPRDRTSVRRAPPSRQSEPHRRIAPNPWPMPPGLLLDRRDQLSLDRISPWADVRRVHRIRVVVVRICMLQFAISMRSVLALCIT